MHLHNYASLILQSRNVIILDRVNKNQSVRMFALQKLEQSKSCFSFLKFLTVSADRCLRFYFMSPDKAGFRQTVDFK